MTSVDARHITVKYDSGEVKDYKLTKFLRSNHEMCIRDRIRRILKNPVYCGKIAYGRRRTEKVHGTRNDYKLCLLYTSRCV